MNLHELTNEEKNELSHFKLRPNDCAYQVVLAVIASDFFDEEKLLRELSYKGISRKPKELSSVIDVSNIPSEQY